MERIIHSFEAGRRGKPDEFESQIANIIVAYFMTKNANVRCDIRVNGGYSHKKQAPYLHIGGEITGSVLEDTSYEQDLAELITTHYQRIYKQELAAATIDFDFTPQAAPLANNDNAGDIGTVIAVAYKNSPRNLPWERYLSVGFRDLLDEIFQAEGEVPAPFNQDIAEVKGLRADGKVEVNVVYAGAEFVKIDSISISCEHETSKPVAELRDDLGKLLNAYLAQEFKDYDLETGQFKLNINTASDWNEGGWLADAGSREAKSYRDGFSTYGVAEDSFSGEDPSKVSATGTLLARQIAVSIVEAGLADFARVMLSYSIGLPDPIISIYTNGTFKVTPEEIAQKVKDNFALPLSNAVRNYQMRTAEHYEALVEASDFFQKTDFAWNKAMELS